MGLPACSGVCSPFFFGSLAGLNRMPGLSYAGFIPGMFFYPRDALYPRDVFYPMDALILRSGDPP